MRKLLLGMISALCAVSPVAAQHDDAMVEIKGGAPIRLDPGKAYLLLHTKTSGIAPVFLRVPTDAETARYDEAKRVAFEKAQPGLIKARNEAMARNAAAPDGKAARSVPPVPSLENFNFVYDKIRNAQTVRLKDELEKTADGRTLLVEALPGDYVFYGLGFGESLLTCLCLGTVSFHAAPGQITDLGTVLIGQAAQKSDEPELASVTGLGPSVNGHVVMFSAAIRPATPGAPGSPLLAGKPVVPAAYRATGKFVAGFALSVNRLAPIPGVLGYDRGNVLDLVAHRTAENRY